MEEKEVSLAVYKTKLKFVTKEQNEYLFGCARAALDVRRWYVSTLLETLKEDGVTVLDPFYEKGNKDCIMKKYTPRTISTWFTKAKKEDKRYNYIMKYPSTLPPAVFDDAVTNWNHKTKEGWAKARGSALKHEGKHWFRRGKKFEIKDFYKIEGFPKFPTEVRQMSFTISGAKITENNEIRIPGSIGCKKLGVEGHKEEIMPLWSRSYKLDPSHINSKNSYTTFSFDGKDWWVSIKVPSESTPKKVLKHVDIEDKYVLGIDVGIKKSITCSDGTVLKDPFRDDKKLQKLYEKEKELSRKMSHNIQSFMDRESHKYTNQSGKKKMKKSCRYKNLKKRHDKLCVQIARYREYLMNDRILRSIKWENVSAVHVEDLNKSYWFKNKKWASKLQKQAVGSIISGIKEKATKLNIPFEKIKQDKDMASSQLCPVCGHKNEHMKSLSVRTFVCKNCGHTDDRDHNAAVNLANWVKLDKDKEA